MKIVVICFFLIVSLYSFELKEVECKIIESNLKSALVDCDSGSVKIGSSGIIIRDMDKNSYIVAGATVSDIKDSSILIDFIVFDSLAQSTFATPKTLPKVGDRVKLNYLYDKALAVTPNLKNYSNIVEKHSNIIWLHPDLLASYLSIERKPSPTKDEFKQFCSNYSIGLLFFAIENRGYFVDCNSFSIVYEEDIEKIDEIKIPFYSRVENVSGSFFKFGTDIMKDYSSHYKKLLGI